MYLIEEKDQRFYIAESKIPGAGKGLFAKRPIKKGDLLEVVGVWVKHISPADQCTEYTRAYRFICPDPMYHLIPMGWGGMANHALCGVGQNAALYHANNKVYLRFTKDVQPHEEVLHYYGQSFNRKLFWQNNPDLGVTADADDDNWKEFLARNLYHLGDL